jgi:hypothetical protein
LARRRAAWMRRPSATRRAVISACATTARCIGP